MQELRIPCPSGLRTRQLKDLSETELLYAVNCLPASPQGGLYLWRPQLDPSAGVQVIDRTHRLLSVCRFRDGLAILHGDPIYNQLRLTLVRRNATGLYIPDSKHLSPFRQASIQEATISQVGHSFLAIATDHYGLLLAEVNDDFVITDWYLTGGLHVSKTHIQPLYITAGTGAFAYYFEPFRWGSSSRAIDLPTTELLPVFLTTVSYKVGVPDTAVKNYELSLYIRLNDGGNISTYMEAPEVYSGLVRLGSNEEVLTKGQVVEFSFYKKALVGHKTNSNWILDFVLKLYNKNTTNNLTLYIADNRPDVTSGLFEFDSRGTAPLSVGGIPVCATTDWFRGRNNYSGKVGASGSYIIAPSSEDAVAVGDPVSMRFSTEIPLQGKILDIQASGSTAVVSTTAESYAIDLTEAKPKSLLPTSYDVAVPTSTGIFILFKGRLFRILQTSPIEVATALETVEADHMTYIDDYGILLLTKSESEEMLAYSEYSGKWVYWRLDEVGGGVRALHYNDGVLLTSDLMAYPLSHTQLEQSYETALYVITPVLPALEKFSLQALELEGDLLITDEQNAQISVTSFSDNQSAYLLQQLGTPWWNTPPLHAFAAGGTSGQHLGIDPITTEPFQGQPTVFNGVLGVDLRSTQYQQGVFPVGRRFILGLNIGSSEKKSLFNVLLGFRLYGRSVGTSLVGG